MRSLKYSLSSLAAFAVTAILITGACKKNDDASVAPANSQDPSGIIATSNRSNDNTYAITAKDGHLIGINGKENSVNPKTGGTMTIEGCGPTLAPGVAALSG